MIALRLLTKKSVATDLLDFPIIPPIYIRGSMIRCEKMNKKILRGLSSFVKREAVQCFIDVDVFLVKITPRAAVSFRAPIA